MDSLAPEDGSHRPSTEPSPPGAQPTAAGSYKSPDTSNEKLKLLDKHRKNGENYPLTTNQGVRIADDQNSLRAGTRGPTLLEDFILREKITHFDHERIPERIVHARGSAAHGYFQPYKNMAEVTKADFLSDPDKITPVFVRFSTVQGGPKMTRSELFALMCGGVASIAGSVLVGYASMGIEMRYLVAASFMSAPGGLLMAKILYPETEPDKVADIHIEDNENHEERPINIVEAATNGAISGLKLAVNVGAMLLALIALIAMVNGLLGWAFNLFGVANITLQLIFSYLFAPIAWLLGVPGAEMLQVGSLLGQKLVLNEFVAYTSFISLKSELSEYSQIIVIMALAGFANLSAPAALIGVLGGIVPAQKSFIAQMGAKVILAGTLSNLMSAALTGLFYLIAH